MKLGLLPLLFATFSVLNLNGASPSAKNILILSSEDTFRPGFLPFVQSLRAALTAGSTNQLEFFTETLDQSRFPDEQYATNRLDYFHWKYRSRRLDLIIAGPLGALDFLIA